jgi:hypothetical protein
VNVTANESDASARELIEELTAFGCAFDRSGIVQ